MTLRSRRCGIAVFVYLVLAIAVKQLVPEFDAPEVAFDVMLAAVAAWSLAKLLDWHWRRAGP